MKSICSLHIPEVLHQELYAHLFPGDGYEHAAVILAGQSTTDGGTRLLARELYLATDGVDHVVGPEGLLTTRAAFIRPLIRRADSERLVYISVHNHGPGHRVRFSREDLESHERGFPTLLDLADGMPVGAIVLATEAAAGEVWFPGGARRALDFMRVVGPCVRDFTPEPVVHLRSGPAVNHSRQVLMFGQEGQDRLSRAKVAVIGAGGVGSLLVEYLSRLGVGHLLVIDPDRIDASNLSRVVGSTSFDVVGPKVLEQASQFPRHKVKIAEDVARAANPTIGFSAITDDFAKQSVARQVVDCDFLFLAADDMRARLVFNAIVQQYCIPGLQIGSIVTPDIEGQGLESVFTVNRWVLPGEGCLWCSGAIDRHLLALGAKTEEERLDQDYGSGAPNPSVITLNAIGGATAANDFLFSFLGLFSPDVRAVTRRYHHLDRRVQDQILQRDAQCSECSATPRSRLCRGDAIALPTVLD